MATSDLTTPVHSPSLPRLRPVPAPREIAIPASVLPAYAQGLLTAVDEAAAERALRAAGEFAGDAFVRLFERTAGVARTPDDPARAPAETPLAQVPEPFFWQLLAHVFATRGWGQLDYEAVHPGVGALDSADWIEADPALARTRPSCHFTAGLLTKLLSQAAGEAVRVVESECRSRGDLRCRFLFGSMQTMRWIEDALAAGRDVDTALSELT